MNKTYKKAETMGLAYIHTSKKQTVNVKIFSCYHHDDIPARDEAIIPLRVGAATSVRTDVCRDDDGVNISAKNRHYCELTGTYWIWKNVKADIVGLCHYRRYLNLKNADIVWQPSCASFAAHYGLTAANISRLMQQYDIILPQKTPEHPAAHKPSVYDYYAAAHVKSDLDLTLQIIKKQTPDMFRTAEQVLKNEKQMYLGNILIAKKELFDEYAKWLFGVLFALEEQIGDDIKTRDSYQQRVYGFIAERLMNVFVRYKEETARLKVAEAPLLYHETNRKSYRKKKLAQLKRQILCCLGLGKKGWTIQCQR